MEKIRTIYKRGERGKVTGEFADGYEPEPRFATEKLDGTNIRVTSRMGVIVRVEKRRNPSKAQKKAGLKMPWYVDALRNEPGDKWLWAAVDGTDLEWLPDGEWSAEAVGPKIQTNALALQSHVVFVFSRPEIRALLRFEEVVPYDFERLRYWLLKRRSLVNPDVGIEGVVWWPQGGDGYCSDGEERWKIKLSDFARE